MIDLLYIRAVCVYLLLNYTHKARDFHILSCKLLFNKGYNRFDALGCQSGACTSFL